MRTRVAMFVTPLLAGTFVTAAWGQGLGNVHFETSCTPQAQEKFDRGLAMVHSFFYPNSVQAFTEAAAADPQCAIAYWGIAISHRPNPMILPLTTAVLKNGLEAVEKGKALCPKTERERDWLLAIEPYYKDYDKVDQTARGLAYEKAMEALMQKYPDDPEAAIFYALALNETALHSDKTYANQLKAGAILEKVEAKLPDAVPPRLEISAKRRDRVPIEVSGPGIEILQEAQQVEQGFLDCHPEDSQIAPPGSVTFLDGTTPIGTFYDPDLGSAWGLAMDQHNNLLVAGYDANGAATIDTYATSRSRTAPVRIRRLQGDATGLLPGDPASFSGNTIAIAIDPESQELYVYNTDTDFSTIQVSVFPSHANGNVAPTRVIRGSATQIGVPGFLGANKISVSADGRLFDAEPNNRILVFAPGADGNVPPAQIIQDSTIGSAQIDQGGVAVRSCRC